MVFMVFLGLILISLIICVVLIKRMVDSPGFPSYPTSFPLPPRSDTRNQGEEIKVMNKRGEN